MKFVRMLLFVFNFLFWALGIALLVVGIMSRSSVSNWQQLVNDSLVPNAANILIAAGVLVALIGFLGCCGALKKNRCMLLSFAISIILIFILQLGGGIYAYTKSGKLQKDFKAGVDSAVNNTYGRPEEANKEITKAIDWIQQNVKCCGTMTPASWAETGKESWWYVKVGKKAGVSYPESCCRKEAAGCNKEMKNIWPKGCIPEGEKFVKNQIFKVGGVLIGIGVIQLLGILFACCLSRAIDRDNGGHA